MCVAAFFPFPVQAGELAQIPKLLSESAIDLSSFGGSPDLIFGLFIGVMMTASLYLFFIWAIIRDKGQVFLMMVLVCLAANMISTNDSTAEMIGLYSLSMRDLFQTYSMVLAYFFSLFFTYYFLDIDTSAPELQPLLYIASGFLFLVLIATAINRELVHFVLPSIGVFAIAVVLFVGVKAIKEGASGGSSHVIAFSVLLLGNLAIPAHELGIIVYPDTAKNYTYITFSLAAMMFAIVIAGQFASRQEEKERALAVSNERFSLAAKGSSEGLFDWDRSSGTLFTSEQLKRITGLKKETLPETFKAWLSIVSPPDRPIVMKALRKVRVASGTATINFEYRIVQEDGSRLWLHTKMVAVKNRSNGRILRYVGSIGDITQRKRSEQELRASETRFRSITEAHPVPVLISKLEDDTILYASPGAETLLGMPCSLITSNKLDRFLSRHTEREEIYNDIKNGKNVDMKEATITRGDAEPLPVALSARRIVYRNEDAIVIGLYDLTERKQAEAQIAQQQEALQQSEKMAALGGLLAGVAHELNNPLSVVMGQTTLLIEGQDEPKVKTRAEKIFKAADRCSRIVKSFLALARRKPPEHKNVNVNTIITNALELLGYQFRNENIAVSMQLSPDLPFVIGDDDQLTQVFANMALNAAQAMHDWDKERQITFKTEALQHGTVLISVIDTGPGIPSDIKRKVFEPFFTTKGGTGGTGVGLAL
ncbi:MAG: PAS domain S-box protein, partial [Alphaproteobacteria bacterium]|nr:PAS domain S-box protein [Alphaproteobacteria bacterium]